MVKREEGVSFPGIFHILFWKKIVQSGKIPFLPWFSYLYVGLGMMRLTFRKN